MEMMSVDRLTPHPKNSYFFDDIVGENWQEFLQSVGTSGVIEPVVATQQGVIVSGHQRVRACKELGIDKVAVDLRLYEDEDKVTKDLIETNIRQRGVGNPNAVKLGRCIKELERIYGIKHGGDRKSEKINSTNGGIENISQDDLLNQLGLNKETYRRAKRLADLPEEIQQMIEDGQITPSTASRLIARLSKVDQEALLKELEPDKKYTQKQVQGYIDKIHELESREPEVIVKLPDDYRDLQEKAKVVDRTRADARYLMENLGEARKELRDIYLNGKDPSKSANYIDMVSGTVDIVNQLLTLQDRYKDSTENKVTYLFTKMLQGMAEEIKNFNNKIGGNKNE